MSKRAPAEQLITGYSFINATIFVLITLFIAGGFFYTKTFKTPLKIFTPPGVSHHIPLSPVAHSAFPGPQWCSTTVPTQAFQPHQAIQKEMVITHLVEPRFTTT